MGRIYTEAFIRKSQSGDRWETDEEGNPIVIIEASNEELDYDGERILRSALIDSKNYFLKNGVISYDHLHLPKPENMKMDPDWNPEKYILGKPLKVFEGKNEAGKPTVFVKAVLSRSNKIAKEIIKKLRDGIKTVRASVGGRHVTRDDKKDSVIVGVDWDEVALTYKPVNQSLGNTVLSPAQFVKSLSPDVDDWEDIQRRYPLLTKAIKQGYSPKKSDLNGLGVSAENINLVAKRLQKIGVLKMKNGLMQEIDAATEELEKALSELDGENLEKGKKYKGDGIYKMKDNKMYFQKANGEFEPVDDDDDDEDYDDDDSQDFEGEAKDTEKSTEKSMDVTNDIEEIRGQLGDIVQSVSKLTEAVASQNNLSKSIGQQVLADNSLLRKIAGAPLPRKGVQDGSLDVKARFPEEKMNTLLNLDSMGLMKSMITANVDPIKRQQADIAFRNGGALRLTRECPEVVSILTEKKTS